MHLFPCRPAVQTASQRTIAFCVTYPHVPLKLSKLFTCVSRSTAHTSTPVEVLPCTSTSFPL